MAPGARRSARAGRPSAPRARTRSPGRGRSRPRRWLAAALEAFEDQLALRRGTPGPSSATSIAGGPAPLPTRSSIIELRRRDAQRVVEHDPHDPRDAARSACAHGAVADSSSTIATLALRRAQVELGGDRARSLDELDRLAAQRELGVDPAEVEQVLGEAARAGATAPGRGRRARARRRCRPARSRGPPRAARASCRAMRAACGARARRSRRTRVARPPGGAAARASSRTPRASSPISSETLVARHDERAHLVLIERPASRRAAGAAGAAGATTVRCRAASRRRGRPARRRGTRSYDAVRGGDVVDVPDHLEHEYGRSSRWPAGRGSGRRRRGKPIWSVTRAPCGGVSASRPERRVRGVASVVSAAQPARSRSPRRSRARRWLREPPAASRCFAAA